jgi:heme-degrading monooxygenase HmoA
MLIRVFHARVQPGMGSEYERFIREKTLPLLRQLPGLVALHIGTPQAETPDEYVMVSVWKDVASLQAFTGPNWREAVVLPGEAHVFKEMTVHHYEALAPPAPER